MSHFNIFSDSVREYRLAGGLHRSGFVRFSESEVQFVGPHYNDTIITLKDGRTYVLAGRNYGV